MNLNEAKQILKDNGFLCESVNKDEVFDFFYNLKRELEKLDYKVGRIDPYYQKRHSAWEDLIAITKYGVTINLYVIFRSKQARPYIITEYKLKTEDYGLSSSRRDFDYDGTCQDIVDRVEEIFDTDENILVLKNNNVNNVKKYTNLNDYKSDIYDALTARGLNSEFAMDYVAGIDKDFMMDNQDIKALADEAVREWG